VTPKEHYLEAEKLLRQAATPYVVVMPPRVTEAESAEAIRRLRAELGPDAKIVAHPSDMQLNFGHLLAAAQVHATLALVEP
jgi:hypothetical protein